jgi:hypothetical protein
MASDGGDRVLDRLILRGAGATRVSLPLLSTEFPTLHVGYAATEDDPAEELLELDARDWFARPLYNFDRSIAMAADWRSATLWLRLDDDPTVSFTTLAVVTRFQRLLGRRNRYSDDLRFTVLLESHRALHRLEKPLVRADYDHALDTWQWLLRLDPHASLGLQLAALFHDVERLDSEADARHEQYAPDYQAFKDHHAETGAFITGQLLERLGFEADVIAETCSLIMQHERSSRDSVQEPDRQLIADADALSFFSLNSVGYLDYFGLEQTGRKVRYTIGRMSASARDRLRTIALPPPVMELLHQQLIREVQHGSR